MGTVAEDVAHHAGLARACFDESFDREVHAVDFGDSAVIHTIESAVRPLFIALQDSAVSGIHDHFDRLPGPHPCLKQSLQRMIHSNHSVGETHAQLLDDKQRLHQS